MLRPDEKAYEAQKRREEDLSSNLKSGAKTALNLASLGAGSVAAGKILPFLSEYIPTDLALKGINKVSPKIGSFLERGMKSGLDLKEGLNFIKEKFSGESENKENAQENRNVIEQYSPRLFEWIKKNIANGLTPVKAAVMAEDHPIYKDIIAQMTKDHKTPFSAIVQSLFGQGLPQENQQQAQPQAQEQTQTQPQQAGNWGNIANMIKSALEA